MKIHDISMPISAEMMVWKDKLERRPVITQTRTVAEGAAESRISLDSHCGTHIDAPSHMIEKGKGLESIPISRFVATCRVLDFTSLLERITAGDIDQKVPSKGEFILLKSRNSSEDYFNPDFVYLDATGARSLAKAGVVGVGIDALGIEREQPGHETHRVLLKEGIVVLEGLRLDKIKPGKYKLVVLPLSIPGIDAAPARAILIEE